MRRVDFYTHVVATTPEDSSSPRRIWRYGERSFPSMRTASFRGFFTFGRRSRGRRRDLFKLPNVFVFFFHASLHGRGLAVTMLYQGNRHLILQQMRMMTSTPSLETDRNNLLDDTKSRIVLEHPIVYDTYDLCAYHREGKLQAFNVAMLKTILRHFEVPFRAKDRKTDLIRLLRAHVHPNGFARWCFCFETILLSNAVF